MYGYYLKSFSVGRPRHGRWGGGVSHVLDVKYATRVGEHDGVSLHSRHAWCDEELWPFRCSYLF